MKFIVKKHAYSDTVEVSLHPDTKTKIYWIGYYGVCVGAAFYLVRNPELADKMIDKIPFVTQQ